MSKKVVDIVENKLDNKLKVSKQKVTSKREIPEFDVPPVEKLIVETKPSPAKNCKNKNQKINSKIISKETRADSRINALVLANQFFIKHDEPVVEQLGQNNFGLDSLEGVTAVIASVICPQNCLSGAKKWPT